MTGKMVVEQGAAARMLWAICFVFLGVALAEDPPTWGQVYKVDGELLLPYAEIKEPFNAWYSTKLGKSRIDYYGGVMKTLQIAKSKGNYGANLKVVPMTDYKVTNKLTCFQVNGTKDSPVELQPILPDLTGFNKVDTYSYDGNKYTIWQKVEVIGKKKNTYTMWVEPSTKKPVRYEMYGYDTLLGSHYDKYILNYANYSTNPKDVPDKAFDISGKLKCTGFPGPGEEHRILMNPIAEYVQGHDHHHSSMFDHFKNRHNKVYKDHQEERERFTQFRHNVRYIHSKNRQGLTYTLGVNHLADKSTAELKALNGRRYTKGYNGGLPFNKYKYDLSSLPEYVDWRLYGAVTPVKDQAVCGSCWSFGTTGTIEGAYFLKTGNLVRLSQQELMDCSWGAGNNACDGGEDFRAYEWIMKNGGLATEEDYGSYLAIDSNCKAANVSNTAKIQGFVNVSSEHDLQALKVAIAKHGPISVAIDAAHKSLSFYSNGVYYEPECGNKQDQLDHAVLAVGYGVLNGHPYWLIKNSWSTYWGNDGYVLMSQKDNNCGVATDPTFVIM